MPSTTPNHGFIVPTEGGDDDLWGTFLNDNIATLDKNLITKGTYGNRPPAGQKDRWYMATDRTPPELYYDTGTAWKGILTSGDYVPMTGGTMTDTLDINHSTGPLNLPWTAHRYVGRPNTSDRFVILLEPLESSNYRDKTIGQFVAARGSSAYHIASKVDVMSKAANATTTAPSSHDAMMEVSETQYTANSPWRFVRCTYNATEYLGLDYDMRSAHRGQTDGILFQGTSYSSGAENLTLINYASYDATTIHNAEIFNSIQAYSGADNSSQKRISADRISLEGKATVNRSPTSSEDIASKGYVDTYGGGGGGGGGSAATIHIDNYGADPTGATASDAALDAAVAEAQEDDRIAMTDGSYRFDQRHIFTKSLTIDGSAGRAITTWNDTYTENLEACFAFHGSRTHEIDLTGDVKRNDQVISVANASVFAEGDGVLIREGGYLSRSYKPTRDVVERVDTVNNTIRLKKGSQYDYSAADLNTVVGRIEPLVRPRFENITFVSGEGNIPVQTRFTRDAIYDDVAVVGYARHAINSWDDLGPRFRNCETSNPTSLDQSSGEAFFLVGGTDITINYPRIRSARRGVDIRSGAQNVVVNEPNMSDITLHGVSFHNDGTTHVNGSVKVIGGTISARQTDPDMSAYQTGNGFNTSKNARDQTFIGTTFRFRNRAGDIYGSNVTCDNCRFEPVNDVLDMVEIHSSAENITFENCYWTNEGKSITRAIYLRDGANGVDIGGTVEGTYSQAGIRYDTVDDVQVDLDMQLDGGLYYHYVPIGQNPTNIQIRGSLKGPGVTSECIALENGTDIDIDVHADGSTGTSVRGIRMYSPKNVTVRGHYKSLGICVLISGSADGVVIDAATLQSNGGAYAVGSGAALAGAAPRNVKVADCNMDAGAIKNVNFSVPVDGLWVTGNSTSGVAYAAGTNVIWEAGNGLPVA